MSANEARELGFRLARDLGHARVHGVDAWGQCYEPPVDLEAFAAGRSTQELGGFLSDLLGGFGFRKLTAHNWASFGSLLTRVSTALSARYLGSRFSTPEFRLLGFPAHYRNIWMPILTDGRHRHR